MSYKILRALFSQCLSRPYTTAENSASFDIVAENGTLFIFLESSHGREDWDNNLNFRIRPYDDMDPVWYCHAGFLKVFKSLLPYIMPHILSPETRRAVITGYSHGGALAILCHEALMFHRPDLAGHVKTFAFGAPRVLFGAVPPEVKARFSELYLIQNAGDAVTHLPPAFLGYHHVGNKIPIGRKGDYSPIDAHRPESYLAALDAMQ